MATGSPRPRGSGAAVAVACGVVLWAGAAGAHAGHSPRATDRYLRVVPGPRAVRMVYTVVFGEASGSAARRRMDRSGDGILSENETRGFGEEVGASVASGLEVRIDGRRAKSRWRRVHVGTGTDSVEGGALSVDLAATFCFDLGGEHTFELVDASRIRPLGEGQLRVKPRGVEVLESGVGGEGGTELAFSWHGPGAIADAGYALRFRAPEAAGSPADCGEPGGATATAGGDASGGDGGLGGLALAAALAVGLAGGALALARRRRRR